MNQQQLLPTPMTKKFLDNKPKFNDQGSFRERLEFLIKWQPNGIHGLELEHLQSTPDDPNSASVPKPVLVRIKRECLTDLVKILDKPKKSIQRGLATFFRSTFGLHNVSNYNREWLIFGTRSDQEHKKKRKTKKKKTALKGKRNLQNNKIKSQPNEGNTQNGNNKNVNVDVDANANVNVNVIGNKTKKKTVNRNVKRRKTGSNSDSGSRVGSISRKRHKNSQGKSKKKQEKAKNKIQTEDAILQEKQKPQIKKKKIKKKINLRTSKKIKTKLQIKKKTDPKLKIEKKNKKISKIPKLEIIKIPNYNLQKQKIRKRKRLFSNVELSNNEKPIKKSSQRKSDNSKKRNILKTRNQLQQGESENENLNELLKQDEPKANNTNEESDKDQEQSPEHYLNIDTIQNDETISMFNQQDLNSNIDEQANQESGLQEFVEGFFVVRDPFVFVEDSQFFWLQSQLETEQFLEFL
ncbi:hypothetical protein M0812_28168 [Anaeramoeba flamelloides]|uniref:Uncharacterized protein n=1 Tax=Anaeramoeba flamelloides TaxID=1746091 RepID=A0AAV7Y7D7_9EUKA|nr:hypothetical protein M0812_28168 [Anaeramoeba flamelloides]